MPHLVLDGEVDWRRAVVEVPRAVHRFRAAVLKTEGCWLGSDGRAILVEGVVVERGRPLHPVALAADHATGVSIRLWRRAPVERTPAVQRWLALLALHLQELGAGSLRTTNLPEELWSDLGLGAEAIG